MMEMFQTKQEYTATEAQTTFTVTGGYTVDNIDVYRNGVRLRSSTDLLRQMELHLY